MTHDKRAFRHLPLNFSTAPTRSGGSPARRALAKAGAVPKLTRLGSRRYLFHNAASRNASDPIARNRYIAGQGRCEYQPARATTAIALYPSSCGQADALHSAPGVDRSLRPNAGHVLKSPWDLRINHLQASRGHSRVSSSDSPVSKRLLRLARICGHPVETASMNFEPSFSSW
jgi:hypothetical protein